MAAKLCEEGYTMQKARTIEPSKPIPRLGPAAATTAVMSRTILSTLTLETTILFDKCTREAEVDTNGASDPLHGIWPA